MRCGNVLKKIFYQYIIIKVRSMHPVWWNICYQVSGLPISVIISPLKRSNRCHPPEKMQSAWNIKKETPPHTLGYVHTMYFSVGKCCHGIRVTTPRLFLRFLKRIFTLYGHGYCSGFGCSLFIGANLNPCYLTCFPLAISVFFMQCRFLICFGKNTVHYITRGLMHTCIKICMKMMLCEHPLTMRPYQAFGLFRTLLENCSLNKTTVSQGVPWCSWAPM